MAMFGKKSVDGVMAKFTKAIEELGVVAEQQLDATVAATERAAAAQLEAAAASDEHIRALQVQAKLRALVG